MIEFTEQVNVLLADENNTWEDIRLLNLKIFEQDSEKGGAVMPDGQRYQLILRAWTK